MGGNYVKKKWYLMKIMTKVAKGRPILKKQKEKKSCSVMFWKLYVYGAWNQKKLSIDA
jgi:hypothetical protein